MKVGISTASFFGRYHAEDALKFLNEKKVGTAEVFLESYCEYKKSYGDILKKVKGNTEVHSVHTLTTQFEPQLYSLNERAKEDSFALLEGVLSVAKEVDARYYTFHGGARYKKTPLILNMDRVGKITQDIIDRCAFYGLELAYENVHWCYYNYIGFFRELKKRTHGLKATFDIKQARKSDATRHNASARCAERASVMPRSGLASGVSHWLSSVAPSGLLGRMRPMEHLRLSNQSRLSHSSNHTIKPSPQGLV